MLEIQILTEDPEFATICQLYWEVDSNLDFLHKVADLADLARVDRTGLASLVREACAALMPDWKCEDCGRPYIFSSRSDFTQKRVYLLNSENQQFSYVCKECKQKRSEAARDEKRRQEQVAREKQEVRDAEKRRKISATFKLSARQPVDTASLSLTDAVFLLSIVRGGAYEHLSKIMPVSMFEQPLSPDRDLSKEIVENLFDKGLIYVHPDSEPEAFPEDAVTSFYIYQVYYAPPLSRLAPDDPKALVTELTKRVDSQWSEEWCQEGLRLWRKVALAECKEYLLLVLNEHHLEFSPGEKTTQYLEFALERFSTAQVFNTIWRAGKDAAAYLQRDGISRKQAANAAVASIQRITERAVAEGWAIKAYGRNYNLPQSVISEVLYNSALRVGDDGFRLVPNIDTVHARKTVS